MKVNLIQGIIHGMMRKNMVERVLYLILQTGGRQIKFTDGSLKMYDDCEIYEVSKEQLEELLTLCKIVLENSKLIDAQVKNGQTYVDGEWVDNYEDGQVIENNVIARKLLPTASGFFFGSTEYDQWYLEDIKHTIAVLEDCLRDTDFEHEVVMYSSSW